MAEWMYYVLSLLFLPLFIMTIVVEIRVNTTYKKYKKIKSKTNLTAGECTRKMLDAKGLTGVAVGQSKGGSMSDYYDPKNKSVHLSPGAAESTSIATIAVAAHEVGHAYQDADVSYTPMRIRAAILPIVKIGNVLSIPLLLVGMILTAFATLSSFGTILTWVGVGLYFLSTLFYIITLPIELNASKRAIATLSEQSLLTEDEMPAAKELLNAAAWTYIAGLLVSIYYFLRLFLSIFIMTRDN